MSISKVGLAMKNKPFLKFLNILMGMVSLSSCKFLCPMYPLNSLNSIDLNSPITSNLSLAEIGLPGIGSMVRSILAVKLLNWALPWVISIVWLFRSVTSDLTVGTTPLLAGRLWLITKALPFWSFIPGKVTLARILWRNLFCMVKINCPPFKTTESISTVVL